MQTAHNEPLKPLLINGYVNIELSLHDEILLEVDLKKEKGHILEK